MTGLLEVVALHAQDAIRAENGGADRIELVGSFDQSWISPTPDLVAEVCSQVSIPVRPLLRLRDGYRTDGGEAVRLRGLISAYLSAGASGITMGFLDGISGVDLEVIAAMLEDFDFEWTFDRAFDQCLKPERQWQRLVGLPGLTHVATAGSAIDLEHGIDDLIAQVTKNPEIARLVMACGDLCPEHVPWLARAGVSAFQVANQVRPTQSVKAYIDPDLVRVWRTLIDDTIDKLGK